MAKILIVNASPRNMANSDAITRFAKERLEEKGAEVVVFKIRDKQVNPCIACDSCKQTDVCVHRDDAAGVLGELDSFDGMLMVTPLYFAFPPGPLVTFINRMYVFFNPAKGLVPPSEDRRFGAVLTYGGSPAEDANKAGDWMVSSAGVAGFGSGRYVRCNDNNDRSAFKNKEDQQAEVAELVDWLAG